MTIHAMGIRFVTYVRKSNHHNWMVGMLADDKKTFLRAIYLDQRDYPGFQHGYILLNPGQSYEIDNLPKNADNIIIINVRLYDNLELLKAVNNWIEYGMTPINPELINAFMELRLL